MIIISAGSRRGAKIQTLEGLATRPLRGRIRQSLFNILRPRMRQARVYDLFAGSGAVGLEAISQGAASCVFVESSPDAAAIITANIRKLRFEEASHIVQAQLPAGLDRIPTARRGASLVIAMPPYNSGLMDALLVGLAGGDHLAENALVVLETEVEEPLPSAPGWERTDDRLYGITRLTMWRRAGDSG